MLTTKYPGILILLELVEELRENNLLLNLSWKSRTENTEADDLTNGDFTKFDASSRIEINPGEIKWKILQELDVEARRLYENIKERKDAYKVGNKGSVAQQKFLKSGKRKKIRQREPW